MTEASAQELSLRDIVETLKRNRVWILSLPVIFGALALIYAFFIAEPRYASTATVNVAPVQVQAQLEQRIQVQGQNLLTFEGLRALAFSEEVTREVWEALKREGKLPTTWQDQGGTPGLERMVKDFKIKHESPKQQVVPQGQVPPVVASLTVEAPAPEVAARAANLWAEAVTKRVNRSLPSRLEESLRTLEEQVASAERVYREAQARWEAFQRGNTLEQDMAELYFLQGLAPSGQTLILLNSQLYGERLRLQRDLNDLEIELRAAKETERPGLLARKAALQDRLAQVESRIAFLKERVARAQVEQDRLSQALELAKNAYLALSQRKTDLQIELASSQNSLAQVIAPAYPVYEKVAPKRGLVLALAVALGLMLGVMAAFVAEALRAPKPEAAG
ncbi:Wzz/FepE/Etk N-terminal domain-containing protein [Thermus caliditerrae]|uniref:Wzz/FepE/Etk N-terminal domain-containing protein n=1 Tax=Thermus caliditerrae TaxID=1330700 RepID=UPI00056DCAB5|nr:Wzz/FepE/Etk N-terminal domain-containing protein [Thermus caliditerrae]